MDKIITLKEIALKTFFDNTIFKMFGAYLLLFADFLFGIEPKTALIALLMLVIADFLTGVTASVMTGARVKSAKVYRTGIKLAIYFLAISSGHFVEVALGMNIGADEMLIVFFAVTEFVSIMENMARLGFATPKKLLNIMEDIRNNKHNGTDNQKPL